MKYLKIFLFIALLVILPLPIYATGMMQDFEDGLLTKARPITGDTRYWNGMINDAYCAYLSLFSPGLLGSNYSMRSLTETPNILCRDGVLAHSNHTWHEDENQQGVRIYEAAGANRFSLYALFPPLNPDNPYDDCNYDVGTYTAQEGGTVNGVHYYHYFRIISDGIYPTHLLCNTHPQNLSGNGMEVPNDPEAWDYLPGWTRIYLQLYEDAQPTSSYSIYYDNLEFYATPEQENDETINSLWVGYQGDDNWKMGFKIPCQHTYTDCDAWTHQFEIRYSTIPITNANFSSASLLGTFNFISGKGHYSEVPASFTITNTDTTGSTRYYFAIKDTDSNYDDYVSKIDYEFGNGSSDTTPPESPTGLNVQ